jgi:hypothetical protein
VGLAVPIRLPATLLRWKLILACISAGRREWRLSRGRSVSLNTQIPAVVNTQIPALA